MKSFGQFKVQLDEARVDTTATAAITELFPALAFNNNFRPSNIEDFKNLMKEELLLNNINDIHKDIINSNEWKDFFKLLLESPESAPRSCKYYCGSDWSTKNMIG